jgi:hypothetical protein
MFASLNIEYMQQLLDTLKTVKGSLLEIYANRTGLSHERLGKMMADETWLNAIDALKFGFVDETISGGKPAQNVSAGAALKNFMNVPAALLNAAQPVNVEESQDARRLRAEVSIYRGARK